MNREERRHPDKHRETKAPQEDEIHDAQKPQEEASVEPCSSLIQLLLYAREFHQSAR